MSAPAIDGRTLRVAQVSLTSLFFVWGFVTALNDILVPHLRHVFTLTYAEAALVQFAFFLAYFCFSLPSAWVVGRIGYHRGVVLGLGVMATGALAFLPASGFASFPLFLGALFVLASGITLLQVTANPYVLLLGKPETASARLVLTQGFNALGTTIAPAIGGHLILTGNSDANSVQGPYLAIAVGLILLAAVLGRLNLPEPEEEAPEAGGGILEALRHPTLVFGVLAIFLYVGAEVSIGSFLVNYITSSVTLPGGEREAASYVSLYWGAAMVGRFLGSLVMRWVPPPWMLTGVSLAASALVLMSVSSAGFVAVYTLLAVGLCNAILFPTIFSLGVRGLGPLTGVGSGLLTMAIVGGAVIPLAVGLVADTSSLRTAFLIPVLCYLVIAAFGGFASRSTVPA